jgi:hypothetical protein
MSRLAQGGMIAGLLLFLYGLCEVGYGVWTLYWPRAQARIVSETGTIPSGKCAPILWGVRYTYSVNRQQYVGKSVEPHAFKQALLPGQFGRVPPCYAIGADVQIAYAQNDPKTAYLEPGPTAEGFVALGSGVILALFGASLSGFARRRERQDSSRPVRQGPRF